MYSEEQIRELVRNKLSVHYSAPTPVATNHIVSMLIEIQSYLIDNMPCCKFVELCSNENWDYAKYVADSTNKQILKETTIFQDFVRVVGRERKINKILKKDE
jgi:hypothetical protein